MEVNAKQLGWILGIRESNARDRMVIAYCKDQGKQIAVNYLKGIADPYPDFMDTEILEKYGRVDNLTDAVRDIKFNYLKRHVTRSYILNYPLIKIQKTLKLAESLGISPAFTTISIPRVLSSILDEAVKNEIISEWRNRYKKYDFVNIKG